MRKLRQIFSSRKQDTQVVDVLAAIGYNVVIRYCNDVLKLSVPVDTSTFAPIHIKLAKAIRKGYELKNQEQPNGTEIMSADLQKKVDAAAFIYQRVTVDHKMDVETFTRLLAKVYEVNNDVAHTMPKMHIPPKDRLVFGKRLLADPFQQKAAFVLVDVIEKLREAKLHTPTQSEVKHGRIDNP